MPSFSLTSVMKVTVVFNGSTSTLCCSNRLGILQTINSFDQASQGCFNA